MQDRNFDPSPLNSMALIQFPLFKLARSTMTNQVTFFTRPARPPPEGASNECGMASYFLPPARPPRPASLVSAAGGGIHDMRPTRPVSSPFHGEEWVYHEFHDNVFATVTALELTHLSSLRPTRQVCTIFCMYSEPKGIRWSLMYFVVKPASTT